MNWYERKWYDIPIGTKVRLPAGFLRKEKDRYGVVVFDERWGLIIDRPCGWYLLNGNTEFEVEG